MEKTARSLIKLLQSQDANLRLAAMRVIAALEIRNKSAVEGIAANLDAEAEALQVQALRALAQLGPSDAVGLVAPKLLEGGAVRQHAAQVLVLGGSRSLPALRKMYARADAAGRRIIASTLAEIGGRPVFQFLLRALPGEDLDTIKHLTGCLRNLMGRFPKATRLTAVRDVRAFLQLKSTRKNPHAVIAGLILLGGVPDPKPAEEARKVLLAFLDRKFPEPLRRNAAISLSRLPVDPKKGDALVPRIVPLLCEPDWQPIPQNLLPLLQRLALGPAATTKLLPLLRKSPHVAVRMHVLDRLHGVDRPAVVREILPFLSATNPRLREGAAAALKTMPGALEALLDLLGAAPDADVQRRIQSILRAYPEKDRRRHLPKVVDRLLAMYEKGDPRYEVLLDFTVNTDAAVLQKRVDTRLAALKRSSARNRTERMTALLDLLNDRQLLTPAQRYTYALLLLRRSKKDVRPAARASDPALRLFTGLARAQGAKLVQSLRREKALGADDYYYVGFHLSEASDDLSAQGQALLEHVVKSYPRNKLRKAASQKLELLARPAARVEA